MSKFPPDPFHDIDDDEPTFAPLILVHEACGAAYAICVALARFPDSVHLISRWTTREFTDEAQTDVYTSVPRYVFDLIAETERLIAISTDGSFISAFGVRSLNEVLCNERFGIAIGNAEVEKELRATDVLYDVRPFILPAQAEPEWAAERLAEFIFGLLDPDDDGLDKDFRLVDRNIPPDPNFHPPFDPFFDAPPAD